MDSSAGANPFGDNWLRTLLATVGHPKNHIRSASYGLGTSGEGVACELRAVPG
jgi:hypothetical protein